MPDRARMTSAASGDQSGSDLIAGRWLTILLIVAIVAGSALGHVSPPTGERLGGIVDHTVLLLVGLLIFETRFSAAGLSWANARFLAIAWIANFIVVPTIGFAIASLFLSGQPLFFTGLIIYFMAPCTDWFLGFTRIAKGDAALGAALLPINMVTQLLLYPIYLHVFAGGAAPVESAAVGAALLQWFIAPFAIAILLRLFLSRSLGPPAFERALTFAGRLTPLVIALLIVEIFAANISVIVEHAAIFVVMLAAIFLFFVATFALSELVSKLAGLAYPQHALLTMTTAARNAPMMLGVTAIAMPDQPLIYAAIIIGMLIEFPHLTALRHILARGRRSDAGGPESRTAPASGELRETA